MASGTLGTSKPTGMWVQNGTAALAPLQVFVPPWGHGDSHGLGVPSTSHRDRSSLNPQVWPCHDRIPEFPPAQTPCACGSSLVGRLLILPKFHGELAPYSFPKCSYLSTFRKYPLLLKFPAFLQITYSFFFSFFSFFISFFFPL